MQVNNGSVYKTSINRVINDTINLILRVYIAKSDTMKKTEIKTNALIQLWDFAIRAWHILIIILFAGLWISAELNAFYVHKIFGIIMASTLVFRVFWGIWGGSTARFKTFVKGPKVVLSHLTSQNFRHNSTKTTQNTPQAGHSPIGGWSVVAMITAMSVQAISGLFSVDIDGLNSGPLARYISFNTGRTIADIHEFSFNILLALLGLHIAAIVFYAVVKKSNLVSAMITGQTNRNVIPLKKAPMPTLWIGIGISILIVWVLWQV